MTFTQTELTGAATDTITDDDVIVNLYNNIQRYVEKILRIRNQYSGRSHVSLFVN